MTENAKIVKWLPGQKKRKKNQIQSSSKKTWPKDEVEAVTTESCFNDFLKSKGILTSESSRAPKQLEGIVPLQF